MYRVLLILCIMLISNIAYAQVNADDEYILEADKVTRIGDNLYEAEGNVSLTSKGITITSEKMIYNSKTSRVQAEGGVILESPEQKMEADKIDYNMNRETGTAENIQGFIAPFNYLCAKSMNKTGPSTFTVKDAKISACSGSVPEWSLSMYEGKLDLDGYMQMNHATVNVVDSPFIYIPKFFYPVSSNRKTGFLMPMIGYSQKMGAIGNIQYYVAPDINYDFTFGVGLYSERGVMEEAEARYALDDKSSFYVAAEHIKDFGSEADTKSRWRATLRNQYVPVKNLYLNLNGDYASDYLYIRDFNEYTSPYYNKDNYQNMHFAELRLKYYNDFIDSHIHYRRDMLYRDTNTGYNQNQLVRMPSIRLNKIIKDIPYVFFEYDLSYDYLKYRQKTFFNNQQNKADEYNDWVMNRFSTYGRLYTPIDLKVLTITPSAYVGYVRWQDSTKPFNFEDSISPDFGGIYKLNDSTAQKYWGGAELMLSVKEIYKDYGLFRHSIQNNIKMGYSPKLNHPISNTTTYYPDLLPYDVTSNQSTLSYEFITALVGQGWNMKLTLNQGVDFMNMKNPLTPLDAKFSLNALGYVTNTTEMIYNHSGEIEEGEPRMQYFTNTLTLRFLKYFYLTNTYTYNGQVYNKSQNSNIFNTNVGISAGINVWRIAAQGYFNWSGYNSNISFDNLQPKSFGASILYNSECWSLGFRGDVTQSIVNSINGQYKRNEIKLYILFSLRGLGDSNIDAYSIIQENPI